MYLKKIYKPLQWLYPKYTWRVKTNEKKIFLTFDDGPYPGITDKILDIMDQYKVQATFFCIGANVEKYPVLYRRISENGHTIGNHSYSHISGYKMRATDYINDVARAQRFIDSKLYRPPYGKMKRGQAKLLAEQYKIIMWDVMPGDFHPNVSSKQCYNHIMNHTERGSIIVLHDNLQSKETVLDCLPKVIDKLSSRGYTFSSLY